MQLTHKITNIKDFFRDLFKTEDIREKKTKKYTQHMIKKYGKTLRRLSKE